MNLKKIITVFVLILLAVGASTYLFSNSKEKPTYSPRDEYVIKEAPEMVPQEEITPLVQNKVPPTIPDWQTYQNHSKGLVFSYPPQWIIMERDNSDTLLYQNQGGDVGLQNVKNSGSEQTKSIYLGPTITLQGGLVWSVYFTSIMNDNAIELQKSIDQIINNETEETIQIKSITLNGIDAKHILFTNSTGKTREYVLFAHNSFIYTISGSTYFFDETYAQNLVELGYQGTFDKTTYYFKDFYESFRFK